MYDPMCNDGAPSVRVLSRSTPVAQHGFACKDCPKGLSITPGTRYSKVVMLIDGEFVIDEGCLGAACVMAEVEADMARAEAVRNLNATLGPDELPF